MHISEESSKVNGGTENMMASRVRWDRFVISVFALVSTRSCQALDVVSPPYSSHTLFIVPHAFHIIYRWRGTIWFEWWGESERENMMEQRCAQVMTSSQERRITRRIMLQAVYTAVQTFNKTIWECDLHWCGLNCLLHLWSGTWMTLHVGSTEFLSWIDATTNHIVKEGYEHCLYNLLGQ